MGEHSLGLLEENINWPNVIILIHIYVHTKIYIYEREGERGREIERFKTWIVTPGTYKTYYYDNYNLFTSTKLIWPYNYCICVSCLLDSLTSNYTQMHQYKNDPVYWPW